MGEENACWSDSGSLYAEEDGQLFEAKTPHFFRIVLSHHIQSGELGIPKPFAIRYGNNLSDLVCLNVPSGDVWKMKLQRQNDEFRLQDGWSDFVKHYSIEHGYFLVFRYEGNSAFHVVIFDRTASEIKYPVVSKENCEKSKLLGGRLLSREVEEAEYVPIEISDDDFQSCRCRRREAPSSTQVSSTEKETNSPADDDDSLYEPTMETSSYSGSQEWTESSKDEEPKVIKDKHGDGRSSNGNNRPNSVSCLSNRRFRVAEEVEVLSRAASLETTNPFFIVLMQPSYVQFPYALDIPAAFFMTHVSKTSGIGFIKLLGSGGRVWTVQYHVGMYSTKPKVRAQSGWRSFVLDNKLQKGDACVFELMTTGSFKVLIYRSNQHSSCVCSSNKMTNNAEPIKNQSKDPSKHPIKEKAKEAQGPSCGEQRPLDTPAEVQVKRGRGRPRKTPTYDEKIEVIEPHNKRRRGRPRKVQKVEEKTW